MTRIGFATLIVAGASALIVAQGPTTVRARITLSERGGNCVKTIASNDGARIRANRGNVVQWEVVNNCGADANVAVGDWSIKGGDPNSPFTTNGRAGCNAGAGRSCTLSLTIRGNAGLATYSYSVSLNGTKQDPDLIIEG
ncbi:MAG: hypothetical protein EPO35_11615 [Acidobacteria bacterium]|nr:MAG: hypothetical protein EPO35_11615 [Acidobacteriota bacterium]